jgi:WD40 repeat protein
VQKPADSYDVFLSYSRADAAAAETLRERLAQIGLRPFLDRNGLPAGQPWQPWLEQIVGSCRAQVVLLGPAGVGSWQHREIQLGLDRQAGSQTASFPVLPILLPGLHDSDVPLGRFLGLNTWIDLRQGLDDPEGLQRLLAGVQGKAIDRIAPDLIGVSPYRGLLPFREQDAGLFFGRERFIEELVAKVRQRTSTNTVAIVGRSGSGKSSVVSAGLFPALRREKGVGQQAIWDILSLRPLAEPLHQLAQAFAPPPLDADPIEVRDRLNKHAERFRQRDVTVAQLVDDRLHSDRGSTRLLFYVDQWEELYTQAQPREITSDDDQRRSRDATLFIDLVLEAATTAPCTLVLSVRSDFYPDIQNHDALRAAVQDDQVSLGPMNEVELRDVIQRPAEAVGAQVNPALTKQLIRDIGLDPTSEQRDQYDIGKLPLLEYALEQAWVKRTGQEIGLSQYAGLEQALEQRANQLYEQLSPEQQAAAKRLFVSLVNPGEGHEDTRARRTLSNDPAMLAVADVFAGTKARLIVTSGAAGTRSAEVSHEALIRHWDRLRAWIDENRENLRIYDALLTDQKEWLSHDKDRSLLIGPGLRLAAARKLRDQPGDVVIDEIKDYIEASIEREEEDRAERKERQHRELAAANERAVAARRLADEQRARVRTTRVGAAFIAALALLMAALAWLALQQGNRAEDAQRTAQVQRDAAVAAKLDAQAQKDMAVAAQQAAEDQRQAASVAEQQAQEQRDAAVANEARALSALSRVATNDHQPIDAITLGLAAWPREAQDDRPRLETVLASISGVLGTERLPARQFEHDGAVSGALWSRDGSRILSWSNDRTLRLWDMASGQPIGTPMRHDGPVSSAQLNRDGSRILSWSDDGTVRLWDAATGQPIDPVMRHDDDVRGALWSRDGSRILSWSWDRTLRLWDAASGQPIGAPMRHDGAVLGALLNRDERQILSWSDDNTLRLWDAATGQPIGPAMRNGDDVRGALWSGDESHILSWSNDRTLRLWDAASGQPIGAPMRHDGPVSGALWSPDGRRILSWSADGTLRLWDAVTGQRVGPPMHHHDVVRGAAWSRNESRVLSWSNDGTLWLWEVATGQPLGSAMRHDGSVSGALWSGEESRILSWSNDRTLRLWDAASGQPIGAPMRHDGSVSGALWSMDESRILSWSDDSTLRLWDAASGQPLGPAMRHDDDVRGALWSGDESRIVSWSGFSGDNTLRLWDAASGQPIGEPMRHDGSVSGALWSPDGDRILSWAWDKTLRLWDAASGQPVGVPMHHDGPVSGALWSPGGRRILSWSMDKTLLVWDAATGRPIGPPMRHDDPVLGALWSRDGSRILSWSMDKTLRAWDAASGQQIGSIMRHDGSVSGALWSGDGSRVLSWSDDGTLRLWDATTGQPVGSIMRQDGSFSGASWSRDGGRILSWSRDGTLRMWEAASGQPIGAPMRHDGPVSGALWSRGGNRVLSWSDDSTLHMWDAASGQPVGPIMRHDGGVTGAMWSRDESRILSWSYDRSLRLWDVASRQPVGPAMRHDGPVSGAQWSRDETRILSWSRDKTLRLWNANWPSGTVLEVACALLSSDRNFDLTDLSERYGISITEPICTPEQLRVPLDWSKIERAPRR